MSTFARLFAKAVHFHESGDFPQARRYYRKALDQNAEAAEPWHNLGLIALESDRPVEAVDYLEKALARDGDRPEHHHNLGVAYFRIHALEKAEDCFLRALELRPGYVSARFHLGLTLFQAGRHDEAAEAARQTLALQPDQATAHGLLGNALSALGHLDEAIIAYQEAIRLQPDYAQAHNNLGNVYRLQGKNAEAAAAFCKAAELNPDLAEALVNQGTMLLEGGSPYEALNSIRKALELNPNLAIGHCNLGNVLKELCQLKAAVACYRKALSLDPDLAVAQSNLLCVLNYDPTLSPAALYAEHRAWGERQEKLAPSAKPHANRPDPERPLRIGYVSPDFRNHAVARFFEPTLTHHDQDRYEVFCYAHVSKPDHVTDRLREKARHWRWIWQAPDAELARMIRDDEIDVLVDLAGHTGQNRLAAFAHRPAPVQMTWLGYPNTTGLKCVDYLLTDEWTTPTEGCPPYCEELIRLPRGAYPFQGPADAPEIGPLPAASTGSLTFGSLHGLIKLNSYVYDLWSAVLLAVPNSRLLMFRSTLGGLNAEIVRREFEARGIGPHRVELRQGHSGVGYLGVCNEIDVALDVFPWGSGTTVYECLWMGVPTLTWIGERHAQRMTAAALERVGHPEFIARTPEEFVAKAQALAANPATLAPVRAGLRERMRATVCDAASFTRTLEDAYRMAWRRWCAGR
jgi:predicted O-linked N-acetylglucosamine transferase (SPINDLY family)